MDHLTPSDVVALMGAIVVFLGSIGGAFKWAIQHTDRKTKEAEDRATTAAAKMQRHLEDEIAALRQTVELLTSRENLYLKRVLQLEAFIQGQKGLEMPHLDNWPPK